MLRDKVLRTKVQVLAEEGGKGDEEKREDKSPVPGKHERKSQVLMKWTGLVQESREEQIAAADPTQLDGLARPTAVKVNKTLRRWQKRAMYGNPQRANELPIDTTFKAWYIEQRDRHRVDLPEPLLVSISEEAISILRDMKERYARVLGPEDELTKAAETRIKELSKSLDLENYCELNLNQSDELVKSPKSRRGSIFM